MIKILDDSSTCISHMFNEVRNTSSDINIFSSLYQYHLYLSIEGQTISYSHSK
nr:MAG TPA: hypothetical protein [Bacteriophage sp.]